MPETQLNYRGHQVVIGGTDDIPKVLVDGDVVPVSRIAPTLFATDLLPHTNFISLDVLVRAVIDHSPTFSGRRDINKPGGSNDASQT